MKYVSPCRICYTPYGWRDVTVYGICVPCWEKVPAERIIGLIPTQEVGEDETSTQP